MTKYIVKLVFLTAIFQFITWNNLAQVSTTLQQTTFDTCGESLPTAELNLGDLVISESLASDFSVGTYTFFIAAPSNFEINATSAVTTGTDITNATVTQVSGDATKLEITLTVNAQTSIDELTLENVRIQHISGATTEGIVSYDLGGNANNLNGLTDADTLATLTFNELFGGTGVNQQLCALTDVQNISVTGDTVTQSRTYAWEKRENGVWTPIANSNTEELAVANANVVNGENRYRRTTTFTINGETCVLTSTAAIITVNEIYPGSITEGGGQNICASETPDQLGTSADVAVTVGGTSTYQWYKNDSNTWELITGANNTFYQPGALTTTTSFRRRITNVFNGLTCFEETPPVTITVNSAVAGGTAVDQDICTLSDLQVLTINNGNNNGTYQWQKNISGTWTDIANATGINYDASGNLSPGIELFRRVTTVSGANCVGISTVATISYSNFSKGSITGIQTICNGETPNLFTSTANANGTGNISYQWERFDGANWATIAGEVATTYQSGPLQQTTRFRRMDAIELNGFTCTKPTNEITVTVNSTVIGATTTDQNICTLSELQLLTVNNGNNNGTYQWQKNVSNIWTDIQNATGINFDASTDVSPGINEYRRVTTVSGANCQGISTVATITYSNFQVGTISGLQTLCYNETATTLNSDTNASGTGTISYQWQQLNGSNWIDITNADGTTYAPGSLTQTTSFRRLDAIELNGFTCSETSNEITVQVLPEILGGSTSANQTICSDEIPTTITVTNGTTTGSNLSYQWQSKTSGNFTNLVGETDADLSFAAAPTTTTTYRRQTIISNNSKVCEAFSSESIVFVNTITAGVIGNNQNICAGETPSTLICAVNTAAAGTVTYTWESSTDGGTTFTGISNATGATYTPGVLATTTSFRRLDSSLLNGKTCTAYTNTVIITVAGAIAGGDGSTDQTVCEGEVPGTISVSNGTPVGTGITFQWYSSTDATNYTMLAGETGENLSFSSGISASTYYRREVTLTNGNTDCTANSTPVLVTLLSLTEGSIGQTQTVCGGSSVPPLTSTADAVSNGAITYSWQDSPDGVTWSAIANANQSTYTPTITDDLQTYFRRRATATLQGTTCEVFTEPVIVYVNRFEDGANHRIRFSSNDASTTKEVCNQEDPGPLAVNFDLIASGTLSYQWQVSSNNINFSTISGATNASYDPPAVTADVYYRRITTTMLNGVACTITSNVLEFINAGNATAGTIGTTNVVSTNTSVEVICRNTVPSPMEELTPASSGGGGTLTYQWFANGTPLAGATGINFTPTNAIVETTLFVRRTYSTNVGGNTCEVNSNGIMVLVPQGDEIGENITLCTGETPPTLGDISLIEGPSYLEYQWYDSPDGSTFSLISGATDATYSPNSALTTDRYYRRGYIANVEGIPCGPERQSNVIHIYVNDVDGGTISEDQQICFGEDPGILNSVASGTARGVLKYQWYSSEDNGATWDIIVDAENSSFDPEAGAFPTRLFKRTSTSTFNGVDCSADSNVITVSVAEEIEPGVLNSDQTICEGDIPTSLTVSGGSTFGDQSINWYASADGGIYNDTGVTTASFSPQALTQTMYYKRRITRTSLNNLTCFVETNAVKVTLNKVDAGDIVGNQSVCEGSQPDALVEVNGATGSGQLSYQWWSSPDNQTYVEVAGANQPNYLPPTTLTTSTYFKRVVTSSLNGVDCTDDTAPVLVTVIPYPIINNDAIIANDISDVSCFGGVDGSIIIPNGRITGGNTAQEQINTITLFGTPEINNIYSIIIDNIVYEHEVTLDIPLNQTETNEQIVQALVQEINQATGNRLSPVIASANANELLLTAKIEGIGFTAFASTNSTSNAAANSVITQENRVANTYEWVKAGDTSFTASTLSINNLTAGVYFLTVYNEFCGITSEPFLVTEPNELILTIDDTCNTALTANSTGGIAPFTFTLTRPNGTTLVSTSNNPSITYTGLTGGATYTVSVQGATCTIPESESVTLPFGLQFDAASVVVENVSCFGQNDGSISLNNGATTVTGGTPSYNFVWTGPNNTTYNTQNIDNLAPGVYVLNVTDQIGCSATYTANIASKSVLEITNVQTINQQLRCAGDTDAEIGIQINSDASAQVQINWFKNGTSFAANSTNLTNLGAGSYEVVVTDTNSNPNAPCTARQTIVITAPQAFSATEVNATTMQCFDANAKRNFTFNVSGGTSPYEYSVDGNIAVQFSTAQTTITGLSNDAHEIIVTDANQCAVQTFTMEASEPILYTGPTSYTLAACETSFVFTLDTNQVTGGTPFFDQNNQPYYLYEWRGPNSFFAQDITSFTAESGSYFLTILDANGCEAAEMEFQFSPTYVPISVTKNITPVSCGADDDGAISISIAGGNRPYSIVWEQEVPGNSTNPNPVFTPLGQNITQLNGLIEGRLRLTITSNIPGCDASNTSYRYQELITINKAESLRLVDGPYYDDALCSGTPGNIKVTIFDAQNGELSFYYEGALVPAVETAENTYSLQIADPVANATLNVANDLGCGFTTPLNVAVTEPGFTFSSNEFEVTGLLLAKEDVRFMNTTAMEFDQAVWDFGDGSALVTVDPETDGMLTVHNFDFPGVFEISLMIFNAQGCSKEIVKTVQIGSGYDVMFPNVFSPNNDGINDYFQGEFTGIASFTFQIYDMWGNLIFTTAHDYNDLPENWGWDGTYTDGKAYENLSFRFIFVGTTGDNQQITETGEATILR